MITIHTKRSFNKFPSCITRTGAPNIYDHAPTYTLCLTKHHCSTKYRPQQTKAIDAYIQLSKKKDAPHWQYIDTFPASASPVEIEHYLKQKLTITAK